MDPAIECRQVGKRYRHFTLDDIDLSVETGTVMGFVGPSGAGKSTTLRIIMGLVQQDHGDVTVLGRTMPEQQVAAKWDIGYMSEDMRLHPTLTIGHHMRWMASIFPAWDAVYADDLLHRFGLIRDQKVKGLSHGQRVKASLLMVLARRPRLLVLDEPTTGLDPVARQQTLEELARVLRDESRTILFSSHNTADVEQLSDRVTFIARGSILFTEDKETLLDRWRRLRLRTSEDFRVPALPGLFAVQQQGARTVITTNQFDEAVRDALRQAGGEVQAAERLTLEEIFITSIAVSGEVN